MEMDELHVCCGGILGVDGWMHEAYLHACELIDS